MISDSGARLKIFVVPALPCQEFSHETRTAHPRRIAPVQRRTGRQRPVQEICIPRARVASCMTVTMRTTRTLIRPYLCAIAMLLLGLTAGCNNMHWKHNYLEIASKDALSELIQSIKETTVAPCLFYMGSDATYHYFYIVGHEDIKSMVPRYDGQLASAQVTFPGDDSGKALGDVTISGAQETSKYLGLEPVTTRQFSNYLFKTKKALYSVGTEHNFPIDKYGDRQRPASYFVYMADGSRLTLPGRIVELNPQ